MNRDQPKAPLRRMGARLMMIQASWNNRTLIGNGFAWTLLPALRSFKRADDIDIEATASRYSTAFNSHPYLVGIALGAVARCEADGADRESIDRFRVILRSPLGALGDALVWAGVLPACLLGAMVLGFLGVPPVAVLIAFLLLFNAVHLPLRSWALRLGWRHGLLSGEAIMRSNLRTFASQARRAAALAAGILIGVLATDGAGLYIGRALWPLGMTLALWLGYRYGRSAARVGAISLGGFALYFLVIS